MKRNFSWTYILQYCFGYLMVVWVLGFLYYFTNVKLSILFYFILFYFIIDLLRYTMWRHGVVVITTAQLHSTKPELSFCTGSGSVRGVLEICDGEDLWQLSQLEVRLTIIFNNFEFMFKSNLFFVFFWLINQTGFTGWWLVLEKAIHQHMKY